MPSRGILIGLVVLAALFVVWFVFLRAPEASNVSYTPSPPRATSGGGGVPDTAGAPMPAEGPAAPPPSPGPVDTSDTGGAAHQPAPAPVQ